jgi:hypothetical protein
MQKSKIKIVLSLVVSCWLLVVSYWLLVVSLTNAQTTPEFLVSWRAINYVPADYQGKIMPSQGSAVEIGFDIIEKNKIVDVSKNTIQWHLDGELIESRIGLKTIGFISNNNAESHTVKITALDYRGNNLSSITSIPIIKSEVVISAAAPYRQISTGKTYFEARPFFFNIKDINNLNLNWFYNEKKVEAVPENPEFLVLNLESEGTPREIDINISVTAQNIFNQLEIASKRIILKVK